MFVLHGHITAVKSLSFCSSGLALVSGGIGGLLNIWSLQVILLSITQEYMNQKSDFTILILTFLCVSSRMVQSYRLLLVWVQSSVLLGYQTWV